MAQSSRPPVGQLSLFAPDPPPREDYPDFSSEAQLASQLPPHVRFGTSSWTFPGWAGLVYPRGVTERILRERGLELYVKNPLFRTVGVDRSAYAPLTDDDVTRYAAQLPSGFPCVLKAWNAVTTRIDPRTRVRNPHYLDRALFEDSVLGPLRRSFGGHVGVLVLEFPPGRGSEPLAPGPFVDGLAQFLRDLPPEFPYAVEIRNQNYLTPAYLECLNTYGVAHVVNQWERMPRVGEQLALEGVLTAKHVVCRLLLPTGGDYELLREAYSPFNRIVSPDEGMRRDVSELIRRSGEEGRTVYVLVNNKMEGSSPLTVRALAERVVTAAGAG